MSLRNGQLLAELVSALNLRMHAVAAETSAAEWTRRAAPGTNLPAFTFWHVARAVDSNVHMGLRGVPEVIAAAPWSHCQWARADVGVGYGLAQADELAHLVVPGEVLDYADAVRAAVTGWLKTIPDEELETTNRFGANAAAHPAYAYPAYATQVAWMEGRPVWSIVSIAVFAHSWAHLHEIETLRAALRASSADPRQVSV